MIKDKFETGMYIVDKDFHILHVNKAMKELYPSVNVGDICYKSVALQECQCSICPLGTDNAVFYNPLRKEWISANAAAIDYPGHCDCYCVQFHVRQKTSDTNHETIQLDNMDEHIMELSGGTLDACVIGGYCTPDTPLSYANEQMVQLMGYDSVEEMTLAADGLVFNTIHPEDVDRVKIDLADCRLNGSSFESTFRMLRKDHTWLWVVARGKRVQTVSGAYVLLCVISDMTEFVQRQNELRSQNEMLLRKEFDSQAALEQMPGGYHRCANAPGWPFIYFGSSFEEITGWTRDEIQNDFDNLFINLLWPEDLHLCQGIIDDIEVYGYSNAVYRIKKKGGGYIWVSDSTIKVKLETESFYHGVLADVTAQIEELKQAKQLAEASSQAKSAFLFNASHDIRTPMNAIQGFAHIIKDNAHNPEIVVRTVEKLQRSGNILLTLMDDVLELSRIEQGKEQVNLRPLNMQTHVEKLYEMMAQEMEQKGIIFRIENSVQHPNVMADDLKLTRIAMNYLSNAKKFTPAGGTVTFGVVESEYDGQQAVYTFFVQDTGIGMSSEFQSHAFEQFERERTSTASGVSGSGLGLSITKKLADLVGGTCAIQSELGKGTRMSCIVPLTIVEQDVLQPPTIASAASFAGMRLLLVEDNDFNREIARYVFEGAGFKVEEAINGVECLEKLTAAPKNHFDFVLMDIQMPIMDGYMATQEIRRHIDPAINRIPIIAITANAFEEDKQRCLSIGMDGHIAKPLDAKAVMDELTNVLKYRGKTQ